MLWKGLSSNVMFYRGLLDKLGVRPEVIRHGAYKAAVEPFIMDRMSPENRRQTEELIGTIWSHVVGESLVRGRSTRRHCNSMPRPLPSAMLRLQWRKKWSIHSLTALIWRRCWPG
ncbi:MAG: S49 family peptidase [Alistipes indistinctus]